MGHAFLPSAIFPSVLSVAQAQIRVASWHPTISHRAIADGAW